MSEPWILMLGTDAAAAGGISSVLRTYASSGLTQRWPVHIVATWKPGSIWRRVCTAWEAWQLFMRKAWSARGLQAVHAHTAARGSFWRKSAFLVPARWMGITTILHLHDGTFIQWYDHQSPMLRTLIRLILRSVDRVLVLSPTWERSLTAIEPQARIQILPNPVDIPTLCARPAPGRVLFIGRVWSSKGINELLEAVAACSAEFPRLRLICAGDGDLAETKERAQRLGIGSRVHLLGWVSPERRLRALQRAQVLVLPSHAEGLPMAILEAMAAGVAVIATEVGGVPDLLSGGGGITVPPGDASALAAAMRQLLAHPQACWEMGRQGRLMAQKSYAAPVVMQELENLYAQLNLKRRLSIAEGQR